MDGVHWDPSAFSLRGLAGVLGVAPNAIYDHVDSRDDLLDAVTERFLAAIRLPNDAGSWVEWVRAVATELRSQLLASPGLTELVLRRAGSPGARPELLAGFLRRLQAAGDDRAIARLAWHAMLTVVVGSLHQDQAHRSDQGPTFRAVLDVLIAGCVPPPSSPRLARRPSCSTRTRLPSR